MHLHTAPPPPQEAIRRLQQQRADLAAEEERGRAGPEEQRDALMAKVCGAKWAGACVFVDSLKP